MSPTRPSPRLSPSGAPEPERLPVVVIGAGPVGLAAATHLIARGERPILFESGELPGATVRTWGHVRMFSPWEHLVDPVARGLLEACGWAAPDPTTIPTGDELAERYLDPLASLSPIARALFLGHRVFHVAREGVDKAKASDRAARPFEVVVERRGGGPERYRAKAVIDASGTFHRPNPLGANGLPAEGEEALGHRIFYGIPDAAGRHRHRYARRRTVVVGNGDSALNALLALDALAREEPDTRLAWAVRGQAVRAGAGNDADDPLPERAGLRHRARRLVDEGRVEVVPHFPVRSLRGAGSGILLRDGDGEIGPFDEVVAAAGSRPDLAMHRELRLDLDPRLECPRRLAPLVDPEIHTCETVPAHGHDELHQPETGFYLLGMKSYGRAPGFLLATGFEQVRSVVSALVGDLEGARVERTPEATRNACSPEATRNARSPEATRSACSPEPSDPEGDRPPSSAGTPVAPEARCCP